MRRLKPALLVVVACGAAWLAWESLPTPQQPPGLALPALGPALHDVDRIEVRRGSDMVTLERRGQLWFLAQHGGYPALSAKATTLLDHLAAMLLKDRATGVMEALGLDDPLKPHSPSVLVRALTVRGVVVAAIVLGKREAAGQFIRHPNDFEAWIASPPADADAVLADWTDPRILPPGLAPAVNLVLDRANQMPESVPVVQAVPLTDLVFQDVRPAPQLQAVAAGTAHYTLADGMDVDVAVSEAQGETWLQLAATGPGADGVNRRVRGWAYAVPDPPGRLLPRPDPQAASQ